MYSIGIDLGGTNIAVGIVDKDMKIVKKGSVPTLPDRDNELIVRDMTELAKKLMNSLSLTTKDISFVGIASPGSVDRENGVVIYSNNIHFKDFPIAKIFRKYLPIEKIYVENDANAAALAEALAGAAKGTNNSVMITLGTGVGGGIIINKKIYVGANGAAGELGHTVIEFDGRLCSCGRRGCWEAYSSATGLVNMTKEKIRQCRTFGIDSLMVKEEDARGKVNARTAFNAQKAGDICGREVVGEYIHYLACGITNMINIFQPEVLSIGGGVCNEGSNLIDPLMQIVAHEQYTRSLVTKTQIKIAELGNDAGIIGAAGLGY